MKKIFLAAAVTALASGCAPTTNMNTYVDATATNQQGAYQAVVVDAQIENLRYRQEFETSICESLAKRNVRCVLRNELVSPLYETTREERLKAYRDNFIGLELQIGVTDDSMRKTGTASAGVGTVALGLGLGLGQSADINERSVDYKVYMVDVNTDKRIGMIDANTFSDGNTSGVVNWQFINSFSGKLVSELGRTGLIAPEKPQVKCSGYGCASNAF